jgi:hypothetical protein
MKNLTEIIKEILGEGFLDGSHFLSESYRYGSYEGVIHSDIEKIKNWFLKRGIDYNKYMGELELPVAFLNNINIEMRYRGKGYGNKIYSDFEQECYDYDVRNIILESDSGESQKKGFKLDDWYLSLEYEIIGKESGNSIMKKDLR